MVEQTEEQLSRRNALRLGLGGLAAASLLSPKLSFASSTQNELSLALRNLHTGEKVRTVFFAEGRFVKQGLREIDHVLRDHRTGDIIPMDPELLLAVRRLQDRLGVNKTVQVISGYRSPKTNAMLRQTTGTGVAKKSYHMKGMAIDLRFGGVDLAQVRRAAQSLRAGGVGYYPDPGFVHVDTGPVRSWG